MYFSIVTAKRDRKCHHISGYGTNGNKSIKAGQKHLRLSNGTIGRGCIEKNINPYDAIDILEKMLKELRDQFIIKPRLIPIEREFESFTADDIPF